MASGSEVACQVSQIVLLESNFSAMPSVVAEGRRVINNIERSASLFLVKNIFSFLLTLTALLFALTYPITPSQLTLFNATCIGIPSFILALEPNARIIRGKFLLNVFLRALPAGVTNFAALMSIILICARIGIPNNELTTMATIIIGAVGIMQLFRISRPFNSIRRALIIAMISLFAIGGLLFPWLFDLSPLSADAIKVTAVIAALAIPLMAALSILTRKLEETLKKPRKKVL
jgi:cation-transporting ATPase E